jgi:Icc protein
MNCKLCFAHLTDTHLSEREHSWGTMTGLAPHLMRECIAHLNALSTLDFALITGDVLDVASPGEARTFLEIIAQLNKPWHFVPGNHDGFIDPNYPSALKPHQAVALLDPRLANPPPVPQRAYWSRSIAPGVQLIALDTRLADDWSGVVAQPQLEWLAQQLEAHRDERVIVATHHPLHRLGPHNTRGRLHKFICSNGSDVEAILDRYPNVGLVISGHHHANYLRLVEHERVKRLHIVTASLSGYPCSYRTIHLEESQNGWQVDIQTHSTADADMLQSTYQLATTSTIAHEFNPDDATAWPAFCAGRPEDLSYSGLLP